MPSPIQQQDDPTKDWRKYNELLEKCRQMEKRIYALEHPQNRRFQTAAGGSGDAVWLL